MAALLKRQHDELERRWTFSKIIFAVFKAEQPRDFGLVKQHFAQLLRAEVGVDAAGDDDAAQPAGTQQVEALLGEQLIEVDSCPRMCAR